MSEAAISTVIYNARRIGNPLHSCTAYCGRHTKIGQHGRVNASERIAGTTMRKTRISGATPRMRVCVGYSGLRFTILFGCVRYHTVPAVYAVAARQPNPTRPNGKRVQGRTRE